MSANPDTPADSTDKQLQMLEDLAEMGMDMARAISEQSFVASSAQEHSEYAVAFYRMAKSVRETIALHATLERNQRVRARRLALGQDAPAQARQATTGATADSAEPGPAEDADQSEAAARRQRLH